MPNQQKLNNIKPGDSLDHFLLLSKIEIKTTKTNKNYLDLVLRDETLSLNAKMWDNFENIIDQLDQGALVKVKGIVTEYMNQPQLKINNIRKTLPEDQISSEDFLPKSDKDLELMKNELNLAVESIKDKFLKDLLVKLLSGEKYERFIRVPAGKSWHHSYLHGLLEHTLELIKICDLVCSFHKEINRDLLITGAIIHDLGKTEELDAETSFDYTDKGKLLGHIVIASIIVGKEIDKIAGFPEILKNQVLHLILSHQGKLEYASPVEPKTLEAIVLYHADELSAKSNAYNSAIKSESHSKTNWTKFLRLANTSLFIPPEENLLDN